VRGYVARVGGMRAAAARSSRAVRETGLEREGANRRIDVLDARPRNAKFFVLPKCPCARWGSGRASTDPRGMHACPRGVCCSVCTDTAARAYDERHARTVLLPSYPPARVAGNPLRVKVCTCSYS